VSAKYADGFRSPKKKFMVYEYMDVDLQPALPPDLAPCNLLLLSKEQSKQQDIAWNALDIQDQI
jgi:hypothetical protein